MHNGNNNWDLHLQTVNIYKLVFSFAPDGIDAKRIYAALDPFDFLRVNKVIARSKEIVVESNEIIVDPATVEGKESHQNEHVPESGEYFKNASFLADPVIVEDEVNSQSEKEGAVADIPKHHAEEEWESYCRENWRVHLLVSGNTICVCDLLSHACVAVRRERSWSFP